MNEFLQHLDKEFTFPLHNPVLIFSLVLFIILLSPILLKRLNIPGIIGLIISGVAIGPHGFNILEKTSAVDLFSTIGLLYIMFIAGLELDLQEFRVNKNKSLLFGFLTFIIPIAVGFPVCYSLLGYDLNASLLTASMFATHTLVAYPIVSRFGISKNHAVAVAVGGTILTDTAVLILLAIIMRNAQGNLDAQFWSGLGLSLTVFTFIMFWIVPRLAKWFFSKLESEKHAHYIFVLSVVFFAAFLAEVAGVEKIIGAFVAGLALNKLIPHSSALMNRIEFIGNALFIPFFLISVGMIVDISVIMNGSTAVIVATTLTIVALFGKWLAAFLTQLVFRYTPAQRQLIFGLSSSHAAATLAIILVGFNAGILDENILNGTIILILITCLVASFVTEKAARKIVLSEERLIPDTKGSLPTVNEHILIPALSSSEPGHLLDLALLLKDKYSPHPVSLLTVIPNDEEAEKNILRSRMELQKYVSQGSAAETRINVIATIDHNIMSGIARISREIMADILLMGWTQNEGLIEKMMGEKKHPILANTDKTIFFSQIDKPLIAQKRIVVIVPPLAEKERGFMVWLTKILRLGRELSLPVIFYGEERTLESIRPASRRIDRNISMQFRIFSDWGDILILSRDVHSDDLLVLISARKGSLSWIPVLEQLPEKMDRHFEWNNKIIIYPQQHDSSQLSEHFDDVARGPISKGIETIGKGIETIWRLGRPEEKD